MAPPVVTMKRKPIALTLRELKTLESWGMPFEVYRVLK